MVLFLAAIETTSVTAENLFYYLAKNREVQQKVIKEIREHIKKQSDVAKYDVLKSMVYLDAAIKETLRMAPPLNGAMPRKSMVDQKIRDIKILKDTLIYPWSFPNHYNEKYYPSPHLFRP